MKTQKIKVIPASFGENNEVLSVCIPVPHIITTLVANKNKFVDVFADEMEYEMIL